MAYGGSQRVGPNLSADLTSIIPHHCPLRPNNNHKNENGVSYILDRVVLNKDYLTFHKNVIIATEHEEDVAEKGKTSSSPSFQCRIGDHLAPDFVFPWMQALLNSEIVAGDTYPFEDVMDENSFLNYFFAQDTFLMYRSNSHRSNNIAEQISSLTPDDLVGCFYIKSNFPGRSRHVCNAGFLVSVSYRNRGSGFVMGERVRHLAKALGYKRIMFNLVYRSNIASNKLWPKLGFEQIGVLKGAGRLRTHKNNVQQQQEQQQEGKGEKEDVSEEKYVDAVLWQFDLTVESIPFLTPSWV